MRAESRVRLGEELLQIDRLVVVHDQDDVGPLLLGLGPLLGLAAAWSEAHGRAEQGRNERRQRDPPADCRARNCSVCRPLPHATRTNQRVTSCGTRYLHLEAVGEAKVRLVSDTGEAASEKISVVLADDHAVVRSALRLMLEREPGIEVVAEAGDADSASRYVSGHHPKVLILDINMPGG